MRSRNHKPQLRGYTTHLIMLPNIGFAATKLNELRHALRWSTLHYLTASSY